MTIAVPSELVLAIKNLNHLKKVAALAEKAAGTAKVAAREVFQAWVGRNNLPAGTKLQLDGAEYTVGPTTSMIITADKWYALWQEGTIDTDQFLAALSVGKGEAERILGVDQVESFSVKRVGDGSDLRTKSLGSGHSGMDVVVPDVPVKAPTLRRPINRLLKVGPKAAANAR